MKTKTRKELLAEIEEFRTRLEVAEETLRAIREGEVDALVVSGPQGDRVYTLKGAEQPYRVLIETMNEGAVTLTTDGTILYCNNRFAEMLKTPLQQVTGSSIYRFIALTYKKAFEAMLQEGGEGRRSEIYVQAEDGTLIPAFLSVTPLEMEGTQAICMVVTDLTEQKRTEEILKAERLSRSILDQATEVIVICDEKGRIIRASQMAHELSAKNLLFQHFDNIFPLRLSSEGDSKSSEFSILAPLNGEVLRAIEVSFRRGDGKVFNLLLSARPLLDQKNTIHGCVVTLVDITERKQMEEELRRSRDELEIRVQERTTELANAYKELKEQSRILESFFKYTVTPLVFLDRDFNFIRVNESYAKACQREVSEFSGHNHFEFYPSDAKKIFEQVIETRKPYQAIARPFTFPDHPEWGTTYWDWNLTPILDDAGEVESLVFSLEDVTKRKRAEEAVKEERQRFNDVLEILPVYLVLLTQDYHVPFANRFFRERFGESHGKRCFEYLFGRSEACETCETYTALKTMALHEWEWTGPDGRNYDVFDFPFTDSDGSTLILEMGIDITERKRAEEALKESESRLRSLSSQLLTVQENERKRVARELHDGIGQLLTAIKFKVENILQEKGEGKTGAKEKPLEDIIPMIIESIEEVRRIQMDLRPSILDDLGILATLEWFCREYQKIYSRIHIEKEIDLQESEVSIPLKTVIYRVMQEAMNNIAKHSKADLVHLSLGKREDKIQLVIQDNGQGFDLEEIPSPDRSRRGIGLNSMRERTELSGGTFEIESAPGEGTTIKATWPI